MFQDRIDAGIQLAKRLSRYKDKEDVLVLGLPRGGVVTGFEIAKSLNAGLDVLIVRKIGFPYQPELAMGAISETGTIALNESIVASSGVPRSYLDSEISRQKEEINRRVSLYRKGKHLEKLAGKTVILVDDGVATGATMKAGIETLKKEDLKKLIVAVPVAPPSTAEEISRMVDEFVCIETPVHFMAVGGFYMDFAQTSDEEVVSLLQEAAARAKGEKAKPAQ